MVKVLDKIEPSRFENIELILSKVKFQHIPKNNRRNFDAHKAFVMGLIKRRTERFIREAVYNLKYPELLQELLKIGDEVCPFKFTSIYINKNVVSPKHIDSNNVGESMIISIGDYTGCNLVINDIEYNAKYQPLIFDGSKYEHYNTDDLVGTKYSLIFYTIKNV
jgi:hypothetical protein